MIPCLDKIASQSIPVNLKMPIHLTYTKYVLKYYFKPNNLSDTKYLKSLMLNISRFMASQLIAVLYNNK